MTVIALKSVAGTHRALPAVLEHTHLYHPENWRWCPLPHADKRKIAFAWAHRKRLTTFERKTVAPLMHKDDLRPNERRLLSQICARLIAEFGSRNLDERPGYRFRDPTWSEPQYRDHDGRGDRDFDLEQRLYDRENGLI